MAAKVVMLAVPTVMGIASIRVYTVSEVPPDGLVTRQKLNVYTPLPQSTQAHFVPERPGVIQNGLTAARESILPVVQAVTGACVSVKTRSVNLYYAGEDVYYYLKDPPPGFLPRFGTVTMAGLLGMFLARKGSHLKRLAVPLGLMSAGASVCYPAQTVAVLKVTSKKVYAAGQWSSAAVSSLLASKPQEPVVQEVAASQPQTAVEEVSGSGSAPSSTVPETEVESAESLPVCDEPVIAVTTEEASSVEHIEIHPDQTPTETSTDPVAHSLPEQTDATKTSEEITSPVESVEPSDTKQAAEDVSTGAGPDEPTPSLESETVEAVPVESLETVEAVPVESLETVEAAVESLETVEAVPVESLETVEAVPVESLETVEAAVESLETVEAAPVESLETVEAAPVESLETVEAAVESLETVEAAPVESLETVEAAPVESLETVEAVVESLETVEAVVESLETVEAAPVESLETVEAAEAAPVESAPVESAPVESAPVEAVPVESAPAESAPPVEAAEAAPVEAALAETTPVEAAPVESAPVESAPAETTPVEAAEAAPADSEEPPAPKASNEPTEPVVEAAEPELADPPPAAAVEETLSPPPPHQSAAGNSKGGSSFKADPALLDFGQSNPEDEDLYSTRS